MYKWLLCALILSSCHPCVVTTSYREQYKHLACLRESLRFEKETTSDYSLVILVDAKHLDYSKAKTVLSTIAKHPNGSRQLDVGHAWLVLQGIKDGQKILIEGGHSGELGIREPRYLDRVFLESTDPNPARHLFQSLSDGYFEEGSGKHKPTYAIRIILTPQQFETIYEALQPDHYNYQEYSLTSNQCTTFVARMAALANLYLDHEVILAIPQEMEIRGRKRVLWEDAKYSLITIPTPDRLEKSMIDAVLLGRAEPALAWYRKNLVPYKTSF